ncbi:unnamed protein product [Soboliphyme baturini]|uniref:Adenylyl cyclase-associated protein n=1 Tax=Soboliphyme baturini TaxID=241478 RepID=A0A183IVW2_9BILA|nr:unnamed protein product [Soboliphyme baturini]
MKAELVVAAFQAQRNFIWTAIQLPKPTDLKLRQLLLPTSEKIDEILSLRSTKRISPYFNHFSTISESISALGWITVVPAPAAFIKEMEEASLFYANRVLRDFKDKDTIHVQWINGWIEVLTKLHDYVVKNHTTGLMWNAVQGQSSERSSTSISVNQSSMTMSGVPPPPPPMSMTITASTAEKSQQSLMDMRNALFEEINKGVEITKGLRKVTADMQTHKNPALRLQEPSRSESHYSESKYSTSSTASEKMGTAKIHCEGGKKWIIENQVKNQSIVVEISDMKQVVYIYNCVDCLIQLKGKANSITVDSCKRTNVVFDNLVSSIEVINCQKVQVQTLGTMPTVAIQNTDSCQVYLSRCSLNAEIISSRSTEMNVLVPDECGEFVSEHLIYLSTFHVKIIATTVHFLKSILTSFVLSSSVSSFAREKFSVQYTLLYLCTAVEEVLKPFSSAN